MPCQAGKDVISHDDITQSLFITHTFYEMSALFQDFFLGEIQESDHQRSGAQFLYIPQE